MESFTHAYGDHSYGGRDHRVIPVVTVEEMRAADAASLVTEAVLVQRAGAAVARSAVGLLGGTYGRHVVVVVGPGNNGADGRVAATLLRTRGVKVQVLDAIEVAGTALRSVDLVIDAAFGTGLRRPYDAPDVSGSPVLAVDIASGVGGDSGYVQPGSVTATHTLTMAAYKPGLLLGDGPDRSGTVQVADIGLDVSSASMHLVETDDVLARLPAPARSSHKWRSAVGIVAGSPGMGGAAHLAAIGAARCGAGMVRLWSPGVDPSALPIGEAVALPAPESGWASTVLDEVDRLHALVTGPGLGRSDESAVSVRDIAARTSVPLVLDGDGLNAFIGVTDALARRTGPTVLTPHEGEMVRLLGRPLAVCRHDDARELAARTGAVVVAKGSTTTVADPDGRVLFTTTGDDRLATAGTGDVLAGMVGALLARGMEPLWAGAAAAFVHGAAARAGYRRGFVASDLPELVARWLNAAPPS